MVGVKHYGFECRSVFSTEGSFGSWTSCSDRGGVPENSPLALSLIGLKVADRKFPDFFEFPSRIVSRIVLPIFPDFFEDFRTLFPKKRRPLKIHQESPPFFIAKSPGKYEKIITTFFWREGTVIQGVLPIGGAVHRGGVPENSLQR